MASKLLLNALKAKIVSNPFAAAPQAGQQQDDPASGQVVGDFHLTPAAGQPGGQSSGQTDQAAGQTDGVPSLQPTTATVSPSVLEPGGELNLKALDSAAPVPAPTADGIPPAAPEAAPDLKVAEPAGSVTTPTKAEPALAPVASTNAVVFPNLTLETDHEAEVLQAQVKVLQGQKRKLTFKRFLPRAAAFAVLVLTGLSASAFSTSSLGSRTSQANLVAAPKEGTREYPDAVTAIRFAIEVGKACPMDAAVRGKLQQQLREETNGLTVNEAIAYWVFACGHPIEAYVDRGFGPWAVEHGIVTAETDVQQPLTRPVMQKIFAAKP